MTAAELGALLPAILDKAFTRLRFASAFVEASARRADAASRRIVKRILHPESAPGMVRGRSVRQSFDRAEARGHPPSPRLMEDRGNRDYGQRQIL